MIKNQKKDRKKMEKIEVATFFWKKMKKNEKKVKKSEKKTICNRFATVFIFEQLPTVNQGVKYVIK